MVGVPTQLTTDCKSLKNAIANDVEGDRPSTSIN